MIVDLPANTSPGQAVQQHLMRQGNSTSQKKRTAAPSPKDTRGSSNNGPGSSSRGRKGSSSSSTRSSRCSSGKDLGDSSTSRKASKAGDGLANETTSSSSSSNSSNLSSSLCGSSSVDLGGWEVLVSGGPEVPKPSYLGIQLELKGSAVMNPNILDSPR